MHPVQGIVFTRPQRSEDSMVTPMRVIDACVSYLDTKHGVCVLGEDGLVHRLLHYHEGTVFTQGWRARCGYHYGNAGERLETFDVLTCIACASGR